MGLYKNAPARSDTDAWEARKLEVEVALLAKEEADYAARVYLDEHPGAVPGEARRRELDAAAKELGQAGYKVIPVWWVDPLGTCMCSKAWQCKSLGKHPVETGWQKSATTDPQWWSEDPGGGKDKYPQANIGFVLRKTPALSWTRTRTKAATSFSSRSWTASKRTRASRRR